MVKRKVSREKYVFAFLITALIFMLGLLLGLVVESKRIDYILFKDQEQRLDLQSLQLQYQFTNQFSEENNCEALMRTFDTNLKSLEATRIRVENYRRDTSFNKREFDLLKREYILSQMNYWLLYSRARKLCDLDSATVLYFFADEEKCPNCEKQAVILTWLKYKLNMKLLTFVFDGDYATTEPMIKLLTDVYNVTEFPTLVINNKRYVDFTNRKSILSEICPTYNDKNLEVCQDYAK